MTLEYEIFARTETGHVRSVNEDHVLVGRFFKNRGGLTLCVSEDDDFLESYGLLLAVADGIGGAQGGATASRLALVTLERHFYRTVKQDGAYEEALREAIAKANERVCEAGNNNPELAGMGCTLSGICLIPAGYLVFSAGDSRVYRARNRALRLLTTDETLAQRDVEMGQMTFDEAESSDASHAVVNWVGRRDFKCTINSGPVLRAGDVLIVCSDGIHDLVAESDMAESVNDTRASLHGLGDQICHAALEHGGWDNLSLILMRATPQVARHEFDEDLRSATVMGTNSDQGKDTPCVSVRESANAEIEGGGNDGSA